MSRTEHDDKIIEQFTRWARPFAELPIHSEADGMARLLAAAEIEAHMRVLDTACGPGIVACAAAFAHRNRLIRQSMIHWRRRR